MTAHFGLVSHAYTLQVGDRLLSTTTGNVVRPWDSYANKSLYVDCQNARAVVSFSGIAHIGKMPTDVWLARSILGDIGDYITADQHFMRASNAFRLTLGGVVSRIEDAVKADFYALPYSSKKEGLEILITGWTWRRRVRFGYGGPRTVTWNLKAGSKLSKFEAGWSKPSYRFNGRTLSRFTAIGCGNVRFNWEALDSTLESVADWPSVTRTAEALEEILVKHIRQTASLPRGANIGTECLAIRLPIDEGPTFTFYRDVNINSTTAMYAPWIISWRGMITPPYEYRGPAAVGIEQGNPESPEIIRFETKPPYPYKYGPSWGTGLNRRPLT